MSEKVNCPFCNYNIEPDCNKCPNCGSLFSEPELPRIKFNEFRMFIALDILTFGFFGTLWFFINNGAINRLAEGIKDKIRNMHAEIKQIFENMIDEKLREEMGKD